MDEKQQWGEQPVVPKWKTVSVSGGVKVASSGQTLGRGPQRRDEGNL